MSQNQKIILAKQIKEDLQKDLEEAKKSEKSQRGFGGCSWLIGLGESCSEYRGNEWRLSYYMGSLETDSGKKYKGRRQYGRGGIGVFPEELEPNDWKEIEGLIQQIKELEKEKENKETQKYQEKQAEINQKLSSNPQMFFYMGEQEWADNSPKGYAVYHGFRGWENNQEFWLGVSENQVANLSRWKSGKIFCLIEGAEKVPFEQKKVYGNYPLRIVKSSDKITITPVDNSPYINELQAGKTNSERYLEKIQKEDPEYIEGIANTKKRISEYEKEIQEEKKWLAEHGNKLPIPLKNGNKPTDKLANLLPKELNDKNLLQYFQKNNVKSIKLDNNNLVIEYNGKQEKETKEINNQELRKIKSYSQKLGKSELTLSDLEQSSNSSNSPNNKGIYIGLAVVGILVVGVIAYFLIKKKENQMI